MFFSIPEDTKTRFVFAREALVDVLMLFYAKFWWEYGLI